MANDSQFDPYHKWLGIPKHQRPPTHYQLLGLGQGESDTQVIEEAAVRQTAHLRTYQIGPHAELCTKLLNEIGRAQQVLLNPEKKRAYDRRLLQQSTHADPTAASQQFAAKPLVAPSTVNPFDVFESEGPATSIRSGKPRKAARDAAPGRPRRSIQKAPSSKSIILLACAIGGGIASLVIVMGIGFWWFASRAAEVEHQRQVAVAIAEKKADVPQPKDPLPVKPAAKPIEKPPIEPVAPPAPKIDKADPKPAPDIVVKLPKPPEAKTPPVPPKIEAPPPAPMKPDPPPADKIAEMLKTIHSQFAKDYVAAKKSVVERAALADKLLKLAQETNDDLAARYVLFGEARDLACQAGKWSLAANALDSLEAEFAVDAMAQRESALQMLINSPLPKAAIDEAARTALASVLECVTADRIDSAQKFVALGHSAAAKSQNPALIAQFKKHDQDMKALARDFERLKKAQSVLSDMPENDAANLDVGRYLALWKGDWDDGLAYLAKGGDGSLQDAARKDAENPLDAKMQHEIGNLWWNLAEKDSGWARAALLGRAAHWYRQAAAQSTGLTLATLTGRIKSIDEATAPFRPAEASVALTEVRRFKGHRAEITSLSIAPDGKRFHSGSLDGSIREWDIENGTQRDALDANAPVLSFSFSPSQSFLAAVGNDKLRIWNMKTRLGIKMPDEVVTPGAFWGASDQLFYTAEKGQCEYIDCLHLKGFRTPFPVPGASLSGAYGQPLGVTLGNDVRVFRPVSGGAIRSLQKLPVSDATCATFSPDGRWLLVGSSDKRIRQFDVATLKLVENFTVPSAVPQALAFSPSSRRFLCAAGDKFVRVWDLNSPKEIGRTAKHDGAIQAVAFTGDGRQALSAGDDALIRLWNLPRERNK